MICLHAYKKYEYQVRGQMFLENEKKSSFIKTSTANSSGGNLVSLSYLWSGYTIKLRREHKAELYVRKIKTLADNDFSIVMNVCNAY